MSRDRGQRPTAGRQWSGADPNPPDSRQMELKEGSSLERHKDEIGRGAFGRL